MKKKKILKRLSKAVKHYDELFVTVCSEQECANCVISGNPCDKAHERLKRHKAILAAERQDDAQA
jgi:hypothetical protein